MQNYLTGELVAYANMRNPSGIYKEFDLRIQYAIVITEAGHQCKLISAELGRTTLGSSEDTDIWVGNLEIQGDYQAETVYSKSQNKYVLNRTPIIYSFDNTSIIPREITEQKKFYYQLYAIISYNNGTAGFRFSFDKPVGRIRFSDTSGDSIVMDAIDGVIPSYSFNISSIDDTNYPSGYSFVYKLVGSAAAGQETAYNSSQLPTVSVTPDRDAFYNDIGDQDPLYLVMACRYKGSEGDLYASYQKGYTESDMFYLLGYSRVKMELAHIPWIAAANITTGNTYNIQVSSSNSGRSLGVYDGDLIIRYGSSYEYQLSSSDFAKTSETIWAVTPPSSEVARNLKQQIQSNMRVDFVYYYTNSLGVRGSRSCGVKYLSGHVIHLNESDVAPTISIAVSDAANLINTYGRYIVKQSAYSVQLTYATKYGATVSQLVSHANGESFSSAAFVTNPIVSVDYDTVEASITDSRGLTATATQVLNLYNWFSPSVVINSFRRCDVDGTPNDQGDHCYMNVTYNIAPLGNQNAKDITRVIPSGTITETLEAYSVTKEYIFPANTEHSYTLTISAEDDFEETSKNVQLSTAAVIMDIINGGNGIAFGKVAETPNMVEVNEKWTFKSDKIQVRVKNRSGDIDLGIQDLGAFLYSLKQRLDDGGL